MVRLTATNTGNSQTETDKPAAHARLAPSSDEDGIGCVCDLLAAVTDGIER